MTAKSGRRRRRRPRRRLRRLQPVFTPVPLRCLRERRSFSPFSMQCLALRFA